MIEVTMSINTNTINTICQIVIATCAVIGCVRNKGTKDNSKMK